jgi:hypothetical protein
MDLGIRQTSRMKPREKSGGKLPHGGVSLENAAESIGIDPSTYQGEAESIWSMLDNLHESDPSSYNSFIKKQLQDYNTKTTILPNKGFVVKTFRNMSNKIDTNESKKLFVNFCSHDKVEKPIDPHGNKISDTTSYANLMNAKIPMVFSAIRETNDVCGKKSYAIDVILSTLCMQRSLSNQMFKKAMIYLCLKSITEEKSINIQHDWKLINATYKGGLGKDMKDVHPFRIDVHMAKRTPGEQSDESNSSTGSATNAQVIMNDPQTLLKSLKDQHTIGEETPMFELHTETTKSQPKAVLIQEIETKGESQTLKSNSNQKSLALKMKGFLNKGSHKPIYKQPSTGDGTHGSGGTYSKFMSNCKVVDTSELRSSAPTDSSKEKDTSASEVKKSLLKNNDIIRLDKETTGDFDAEFDAIMNREDPSFARSFHEKRSDDVVAAEELDHVMKQLAEETCISQPPKKQSVYEPIEVERGDGQERNSYPAQIITFTTDSTEKEFGMKLNLRNTKVSTVDDIDVEVCDGEVNVSTSCGEKWFYSHRSIHETMKAKYKKKAKILLLTFPFRNHECN